MNTIKFPARPEGSPPIKFPAVVPFPVKQDSFAGRVFVVAPPSWWMRKEVRRV